MTANTQTVTLACDPREVFAFLANPENLPKWAFNFCKSIRPDRDQWIVQSPEGEIAVRYITDSSSGTIDFHLSPAPGVETVAASRVIPNGDGSEYVFTHFQVPGMPDEAFRGNILALAEELQHLQKLMVV